MYFLKNAGTHLLSKVGQLVCLVRKRQRGGKEKRGKSNWSNIWHIVFGQKMLVFLSVSAPSITFWYLGTEYKEALQRALKHTFPLLQTRVLPF